jgi:hypothetical protein
MPKRSVARTPLLLAGALAVFLVHPAPDLHAQTVEEDLMGLALENAEGYVQPLTFGMMYAMNGGLFDSAAPMRRFGFEVGARAMAAESAARTNGTVSSQPACTVSTRPSSGSSRTSRM